MITLKKKKKLEIASYQYRQQPGRSSKNMLGDENQSQRLLLYESIEITFFNEKIIEMEDR